MKQPETSFSATASVTLFPAVGPSDVAAAPLPVKVSFGESSKSSTAQTICINYTKGLSDEQVRERLAVAQPLPDDASHLFRWLLFASLRPSGGKLRPLDVKRSGF
jgi:hypothetical protein